MGCGENKIVQEAIGVDPVRTSCVDVVGSAEHLPLREGVFDYVVASEVLERLDNAESAIDEICRVMHSTGEFLVTVPKDTLSWHIIWSLWSNTFGRRWKNAHRRHFTENWLSEVLASRIRILNVERVNCFLHFIRAKQRERAGSSQIPSHPCLSLFFNLPVSRTGASAEPGKHA